MEVRPFRDSNYDLRRVEQDMAAQAVVVVQDTAVQATGGQVRGAKPAWWRCLNARCRQQSQSRLHADFVLHQVGLHAMVASLDIVRRSATSRHCCLMLYLAFRAASGQASLFYTLLSLHVCSRATTLPSTRPGSTANR